MRFEIHLSFYKVLYETNSYSRFITIIEFEEVAWELLQLYLHAEKLFNGSNLLHNELMKLGKEGLPWKDIQDRDFGHIFKGYEENTN